MAVELTFDRSIALLAAAERHIDGHLSSYSDRDDMAGTRLLLETLHKIVEDAQRQVISIQRRLQEEGGRLNSEERERQIRQVRNIARDTAFLTGQPLHYVTSPHGREFDPIAIAYARMAREIEPHTELIFRGSEHRGYALSPPLLNTLIDNLVARGTELTEQIERLPTILYLQYPALAEGDVLQHLLIAHEIAHLALRHRVGERTDAEARFETARKSVSPRRAAPPSNSSSKSDPRTRGLKWFTEIACDIIAMRLVGPAYYLALCEHALVREWFYRPSDSETATHPHLAWRLTLAGDQLERFYSEMDPALAELVRGVLMPYREAIPDPTPQIEKEPYAKTIKLALKQLVADLDKEEVIGNAGLDPVLLADELPFVLERLGGRFAPAERIEWSVEQVLDWKNRSSSRPPRWSQPVDWRSILNGGYLYTLMEVSPAQKPLRGAWLEADWKRRQTIAHLRGTVELSEFQRAAEAVDNLRVLDPELVA